jgi:hypothetical protein
MSSSLAAYVIDLAKLRAAIGSRDRGLIDAIRGKYDADWLDVTVGEALEQLVNGDPLPREGTGEHGVALELLSAHVGTRLKGNWWGSIKLVALEEAGVEGYVTNGPPVPLPTDVCAGGPMMGHLTREVIRDLVADADRLFPKDADEDLKLLRNEFEGWLRTAASQDKDLVFFCG